MTPLITIGMVVRNGERWVGAAIDSLLAQTFDNFVLRIHDNASTDGTISIVRSFMAMDDRVRLASHPRDVGVVGNLISAAATATTPLFCWAACDDLRAPHFLDTLRRLLEHQPCAGVACCAVRNMDPNGSLLAVRPETQVLNQAGKASARARLQAYLRTLSGTPFYGLFRTELLHRCLDVLHRIDQGVVPPQIGLDMLFLTRFVRDHPIAYTPEPLLYFRRGGMSHDLARYGSLREYLRQVATFARLLRMHAHLERACPIDHVRLATSREIALGRWLLSRDMRRMTAHYILGSVAIARRVRCHLVATLDPSLRHLRLRLRERSAQTRVVLMGAGKHTARRLEELQRAISPWAAIVGICDDCPPSPSLCGVRVLSPDELRQVKPDVVLVSSDTYERVLFERARQITPVNCLVWCLYDTSLETAAPVPPHASSTSATNAARDSSTAPRSPVFTG